jgi:hypothetical protein
MNNKTSIISLICGTTPHKMSSIVVEPNLFIRLGGLLYKGIYVSCIR